MERTPEELRRAFWEDDASRGAIIRKQYDEIKEVLEKNDLAWVQEQLRAVKQHAIDQTEYYKNCNIDDAFPIVNKNSILANYEAHKAKGGFDLPLHTSSTSGSTGTPFSVIQDYRKRMRHIADLKVFGELCDYPSHERMIFFRIFSDKLHRTPEQEARENIFCVDSSELSEKHLEEMLQVILEKKPRIIFSYPSTLVELAKYLAVREPQVKCHVRAALTGGEGIPEDDRKLVEQTFKCTVYRRYSDMELGILGQDLGDGKKYFLNYGSYYFECLKEDCDEPAGPGEVGRIVVTDLFNYAFPMIRYDTGDLGILDDTVDGKFPMFKEIYGKKRDCIYTTDGRMLSPAKIFVSMWGIEGIKQWQFIQETANEYILKINSNGEVNHEKIVAKIKGVVGEDAIITVEYVEEIPVITSRKRRAIVCNYKKEK